MNTSLDADKAAAPDDLLTGDHEPNAGPSTSSTVTKLASPYFFDQGLRKVHPYNHTYLTYAKQRWLGRELLEVFATEFRDRSRDFYDWAISNGTVMVNGQIVGGKYILRNGDLISNVVHRHEPPIIGGSVEVYHKDEEHGVWVVEKKASMPIHSTGRYRSNTLLEVLKNEHGLDVVSTANRLDRLVSGVILVATTRNAAQRLGADFGTPGRVQKEYVARVVGEFPLGDSGADREDQGVGEVICDAPMLTIDKQIGVNVVHPSGRPSKTIFTRLSYDPRTNTSVVRCRPITGRSHQLRVHLQYLGHPIANDPIYNNSVAWGKSNAKGGLWQELTRKHILPAAPPQPAQSLASTSSSTSIPSTPGTNGTDTPEAGQAIAASIAALADSLEESITPLSRAEVKLRKKEHKAALAARQAEKRASIPAPFVEESLRGGAEAPLTPAAVGAILHLRKVRDEEDNFARYRDMDRPPLPASACSDDPAAHADRGGGMPGLLTSSVSAKKGIKSLSKHEREALAACTAEALSEEHTRDPRWYIAEDEEGEYCKACGIPLLPDPTLDMLQIWLHAIRYHTEEWDYSSPLPEWAQEDWKPVDPSAFGFGTHGSA